MRQPPLDDLIAVARTELRTNPTITAYTMTWDGLELRWPANPWAVMTVAMDMLIDSLANLMGFGADFTAAVRRLEPPRRSGE